MQVDTNFSMQRKTCNNYARNNRHNHKKILLPERPGAWDLCTLAYITATLLSCVESSFQPSGWAAFNSHFICIVLRPFTSNSRATNRCTTTSAISNVSHDTDVSVFKIRRALRHSHSTLWWQADIRFLVYLPTNSRSKERKPSGAVSSVFLR